MCRYARNYKDHFVCFVCRKSFKRRLKSDVDPSGDDHPARCPQCRSEMAAMGPDFKPPSQRKLKEWATLEKLWTIGETFYSCGCSGPGYRPRTQRQYAAYLDEVLVRYRANVERWKAEIGEGSASGARAKKAHAHWRERVTRIEAEITAQ